MNDGQCVCGRFEWSMISIEPERIIVRHTPHFPQLTDPVYLVRSDLPAGVRVDWLAVGVWAELETARQAVCFVDLLLFADYCRREGVDLVLS